MISHKTLGHPATLFALGVVSFIIGLKGTMMIDDAVRADRAVAGVAQGPEATGALLSGAQVDPSNFVGTWEEQSASVLSGGTIWIHDVYVNGAPRVTRAGNWRVWEERYENGVLSFRARGGDSDWELIYWVVYDPNTPDRLRLRVNRVHDNSYFDGELIRSSSYAPPPAPTDSYASSPPEGVPGGVPGGVVGGGSEETPQRIRVSSSAALAKVVDRVDPTYPALAREARVQGTVLVQTVIDVDGYVIETRVQSGHPLLTQAAIDAVQQWVFEQTYLSGSPVEVETTIPITFKLSEAASSAPTPAPTSVPAAPNPPPAAPSVPTPSGLQAFAGTWSSRWADVNETNAFTLSIEGGRPRVTRADNWRVWEERFDGRVLSFRTQGGDSDWSFVYYLEYAGPNRLKLRVHRNHDNQDFSGEFYR